MASKMVVLLLLGITLVRALEPFTAVAGAAFVGATVYSMWKKCYFQNLLGIWKVWHFVGFFMTCFTQTTCLDNIWQPSAHIETTADKVLLSHGSCTGKTHLSNYLIKTLFAPGSFHGRIFHATEFPDPGKVYHYKKVIRDAIIEQLKSCDQALFVFVDSNEFHPGVLDILTEFMSAGATNINGIDYTKAIFIIQSNLCKSEITEAYETHLKSGKSRESLELRPIENVLRTCIQKSPEGQTSLYKKHVVQYVPFLPLERKHVLQCIDAYLSHERDQGRDFKWKDLTWSVDVANLVADNVDMVGEFSLTGCKGVNAKVNTYVMSVLAKRNKQTRPCGLGGQYFPLTPQQYFGNLFKCYTNDKYKLHAYVSEGLFKRSVRLRVLPSRNEPSSWGQPRKSKRASLRSFELEKYFYPRVLNAGIHPMVGNFMRLGNERIAARYCHLNPKTDYEALLELLNTTPDYFRWAGADLFNVTNSQGQRQMIVIETNSCPSGQKSMPSVSEEEDSDGYHKLMKTTFLHFVRERKDLPTGGLAVIYDKNPMEAQGYAAAMADASGENVLMVEFYETDPDPPVQFRGGVMHVRDENKNWHPIRAAFRYVTQTPWNRIPVTCRTFILNPIISCLAGGRNKMAADKAYEFLNKECMANGSGLRIRVPETIRDVSLSEVPLWVKSMGGHAVVKVPYSNAGQGVYTICNDEELQAFLKDKHAYGKFIVQSLVGNASWSSVTRSGQFFHTGTIPNRRNETFVSDLRMMISATSTGWQPVAVYARRALKPLVADLKAADDSWSMLGTNLSVKLATGDWSTETERLLLMDLKDFNRLGLGTDDLIDAYVQTVLSTVAIDRMATRLIDKKGRFDRALYASLNADDALLNEILTETRSSPAAGAGAGAGAGTAAGAGSGSDTPAAPATEYAAGFSRVKGSNPGPGVGPGVADQPLYCGTGARQ